jgi:FAD/FMN-containing dehydrogenase
MFSGRDHAHAMNTDPTACEIPADALRAAIRGPVLAPGDPGYDAARRVWNGSIDKYPSLLAQCTGAADVTAALRVVASPDLPVSIRGGGHSFAGFGTCDEGLVIDLALMKGIRVDPRTRRVIAQGGVTWGELDHETAAFELATTGGLISSTGIAGLTLGGGIGWLMRKHGLACDNLIAADVIAADGQLLHVSGEEHPELFWALRGGGGNFGVVTAFEYQLHPVSTVLAGALICPGEKAAEVMKHYAEWTADEPDELCTLVEFATAPDADFIDQAHRGKPAVFVVLCHCGPLADAEAAIGRLRKALPLIADLVEPMPYPAIQSFFDEDYPAGLWSYTKSHYLDYLDGASIAALAAAAAALPARSFIDLHHLEGAPSRIDSEATAFDHRQARYAVVFGGVCEDKTGFAECRAWAQEHWSALASHATGSAYSNFMADADENAVRAAWGPQKYERLVAVKGKYDPANRFRFNHNIRPAVRRAGN